MSEAVGPFAEHRLDEPFGLAIGLWSVGPGEVVADGEHPQRLCDAAGSVSASMVRREEGLPIGYRRARSPRIAQRVAITGSQVSTVALLCRTSPAVASTWMPAALHLLAHPGLPTSRVNAAMWEAARGRGRQPSDRGQGGSVPGRPAARPAAASAIAVRAGPWLHGTTRPSGTCQ